MSPSYRQYWDVGFEWQDYLQNEVEKHRELWQGVYDRVKVPEWAIERTAVAAAGCGLHLLVIAEDWCGDASNTVPVIARFSELAPELPLRVVKRDEHPELMDSHLTDGSRSIPIVIVLDAEFRPLGHWGPRPAELQSFVLGEKRAGVRPKADIYKDARRWYARDRGETTLCEFVEMFERACGVASGDGRGTQDGTIAVA